MKNEDRGGFVMDIKTKRKMIKLIETFMLVSVVSSIVVGLAVGLAVALSVNGWFGAFVGCLVAVVGLLITWILSSILDEYGELISNSYEFDREQSKTLDETDTDNEE